MTEGRIPLQLVAVGKIKGSHTYLQAGVDEYVKRLRPYVKLSVVEVAEEPVTPTRTREQVLEKEGERLLKQMAQASIRVVLSEYGESVHSQQLAQRLAALWTGGDPLNGGVAGLGSAPMMVVVGGPLGLSQEVLRQADWVLSLSPLTFPHQMVRLLFLEQLYRSFRILRGEPYHK